MTCEDLARDPPRRALVQPRWAAGFTLVELITVILLVAILSAVAAPRFMQREAFEERGFFDGTRALLKYAQRLAIAERREVCVTLAAASVALTLNPTTIPGAACSAAVIAPGGDTAFPTYTITAPAGLVLAFPNAVFRFNALGQPIDNATGALLGNQAISLTGSGVRTITVAGETGHVL